MYLTMSERVEGKRNGKLNSREYKQHQASDQTNLVRKYTTNKH